MGKEHVSLQGKRYYNIVLFSAGQVLETWAECLAKSSRVFISGFVSSVALKLFFFNLLLIFLLQYFVFYFFF